MEFRRAKHTHDELSARMMDRDGEQCTLMSDGKQGSWSQWPAPECSMCGDVGFADQLHQCPLCRFRYQHTYCYTSMEGLRTGIWICDWCRLLKKEKIKNGKGVQASQTPGVASSIMVEGSGILECPLKRSLNDAQHTAAIQTSSRDGGSLCSSSVESVKELESSRGALKVYSCCSEDGESQGEETRSALTGASPRGSTCDSKRSPKSLRCGIKMSQKRRQKSLLEQQCGSVQLKRLSSLKSSKTGIACDLPKSFVRRYKSLSEISF